MKRAFTLIELVIVVAILGLLAALLMPALAGAIGIAHQTTCAANLRQLGIAMQLYLKDSDGWFFPLYTPGTSDGRTWYYGFEPNGSPSLGEGNRILDPARGKLYPYLQASGGVTVCPSVPFGGAYKPKYKGDPSWTYGVNRYLSTHPSTTGGNVNGNGNSPLSVIRGRDAARTAVFADAAQVAFLPPATPSNPMIEDFPYIEPNRKYVQFRHNGQANVLYADWHVGAAGPAEGSLDARMPGTKIGYFDPDEVLLVPKGAR